LSKAHFRGKADGQAEKRANHRPQERGH
jgi:hypothetical protein